MFQKCFVCWKRFEEALSSSRLNLRRLSGPRCSWTVMCRALKYILCALILLETLQFFCFVRECLCCLKPVAFNKGVDGHRKTAALAYLCPSCSVETSKFEICWRCGHSGISSRCSDTNVTLGRRRNILNALSILFTLAINRAEALKAANLTCFVCCFLYIV